jgi:hypothetical protein
MLASAIDRCERSEQWPIRLQPLVSMPLVFTQHHLHIPLVNLLDVQNTLAVANPNGGLKNMSSKYKYPRNKITATAPRTKPDNEIQNQQGDWVEAPQLAGSFVVNIGNIMQY